MTDNHTCPKCQKLYPVAGFLTSKCSGNPIGHCRPCRNAYSAERRRQNPEKTAAYRKTARENRKNGTTYKPRGPVAEKRCTKCGVVKPIDDFGGGAAMSDGKSSRCRKCVSETAAEYNRTHPEKFIASRRRHYLKVTYGTTPEILAQILEAQGGVCAICGTSEPGGNYGKWNTDHCHEHGHVRGLLCWNCNTGIGKLADDPDRLEAAAKYLRDNALPPGGHIEDD